ncbi:MAG: hypothetical protein ACOVRP_10510, partial [Gemmatimonas sp.]
MTLLRWLCLFGLVLLFAGAQAAAPEDDEILIAVADRGGSLGPAGSTARGAYRRAGGYGAGTWAQHVLGELARTHALQPGEDWRIAALDLHCQRLRLPPGRDREALLAALQRDPRVALAQPLQRFEGQGALFNDPYYPLQTHLQAIGAEGAQRVNQGAGVRVALIDSGVDAS